MLGCEGIDWWIVAWRKGVLVSGKEGDVFHELRDVSKTHLKHLHFETLLAQVVLAQALESCKGTK